VLVLLQQLPVLISQPQQLLMLTITLVMLITSALLNLIQLVSMAGAIFPIMTMDTDLSPDSSDPLHFTQV
jgi:hypothetical protein